MMKLTRQARETLEDVSDASRTVINTTEWATVALVAVAAVSLLALGLAVLALHRRPA
jgi:CHASE3 domain sensor protein